MTIRRELLTPPQSGGTDQVYVWAEIVDGEVQTMISRPETDAEWDEMRRFLAAAEKFDIDDPETHVVEY